MHIWVDLCEYSVWCLFSSSLQCHFISMRGVWGQSHRDSSLQVWGFVNTSEILFWTNYRIQCDSGTTAVKLNIFQRLKTARKMQHTSQERSASRKAIVLLAFWALCLFVIGPWQIDKVLIFACSYLDISFISASVIVTKIEISKGNRIRPSMHSYPLSWWERKPDLLLLQRRIT